MAPVTMPVLVAGLFLFLFGIFQIIFGFGTELPTSVRKIFNEYENFEKNQNLKKIIQKQTELVLEFIVLLVFDCSISYNCCCRYYWSRSTSY